MSESKRPGVSPAALVFDSVRLGPEARVDAFVVLGVPPVASPANLETHIGEGCIIRSHTVIYAGNRIGDRFVTGHGALIREYNQIGEDVSVGSHAVIEHRVQIGRGVRIHTAAFVPEHTVLEDESWIGPHAVLTNARYPVSRGVKERLRGPLVRRGAMVGAGATLLSGVEIGAHALVGAGSVVVRDVPPGSVVLGNPARVVREVADLDVYSTEELLGRREEDSDDDPNG
jgi:acetyltransferase-like isoleucine patch superfamily enzyme